MSVVPYLKYMMLVSSTPNPTLTPAVPANPKTGAEAVSSHCNGVNMEPHTHKAMIALMNDFNVRKNDLFKEFPDQFLIAQAELIDEMKTTGNMPVVDLSARQLRRTGINFGDLMDELIDDDDEGEDDLDDLDDLDDVEPVVETKKAVNKPIAKKRAPAVKKDTEKTETVPKKRGGGRKKVNKENKVEEVAKEEPVDPASNE